MKTLLSCARLFVLLATALLAVQVPFYVGQYGATLAAHYAESQRSLGQFQDEADRFFDGSIAELVSHYRDSDDEVFRAGGESIQAIYHRNLVLERSLARYRTGPVSAYTQALVRPVPEIKRAVLSDYSYVIRLDPGAIVFGLGVGVALTLVLELLARGGMLLVRSARRRRRAVSRGRA